MKLPGMKLSVTSHRCQGFSITSRNGLHHEENRTVESEEIQSLETTRKTKRRDTSDRCVVCLGKLSQDSTGWHCLRCGLRYAFLPFKDALQDKD